MEDLKEQLKKASTGEGIPDVTLTGRGFDFPPITGEQWEAVNEAANLLAKAGLSTLTTNFYTNFNNKLGSSAIKK